MRAYNEIRFLSIADREGVPWWRIPDLTAGQAGRSGPRIAGEVHSEGLVGADRPSGQARQQGAGGKICCKTTRHCFLLVLMVPHVRHPLWSEHSRATAS